MLPQSAPRPDQVPWASLLSATTLFEYFKQGFSKVVETLSFLGGGRWTRFLGLFFVLFSCGFFTVCLFFVVVDVGFLNSLGTK